MQYASRKRFILKNQERYIIGIIYTLCVIVYYYLLFIIYVYYIRIVRDKYNHMVLRRKYPYKNIRNIDVLTIDIENAIKQKACLNDI